MTTERRRMPLHTKIFIGLLLGAIAGGVCQAVMGPDDPRLKFFRETFAQPVGTIFLNMIFMVVLPLLFSALVLGVAEIGDARKLGRVGARALLMTVILSGIAVVLGLAAVNLVKPGDGISTADRERLMASYQTADATKKVEDAQKAKGVADTLVGLIPKNPISAAIEPDGILPFMVFALIFGIALGGIAPEKALPVKAFLEGVFAVTLRIIDFAMRFAPIGVFGLIFTTASLLGVSAFVALGKYAGLVLVTLAIHLFVTYPLAIRWIAKRNPIDFFRSIRSVMLTAFATASSNATLPAALKSADEDLGLPRDISNFVLTVGATANQNGTALFEGITVLFLAQFFGIPLSLGAQAIVMGMAILAGIGTAGVPGGSWPMIAIILIQVGVPAEAIGICLGIDRILDMSRTVLNVTGDITIATCVAQMEGEGMEPAAAMS
ncbi:MAG TPA: dicarboxylate/amino acid:cation symporter [Fimbriimonadaceae bacterium]|nr:dicarboxylate/amino acid:cation symporter [Fimbriimonadaceae bacterium]HRJ95177.1 dicarboxylate/amino acid:cation symporter [Fimbriimonadaceae bacterium]